MTHAKKFRKLPPLILFCVFLAASYFLSSYFNKKNSIDSPEKVIAVNKVTSVPVEVITFLNKDFKLLSTEFTEDTKVWSSFFVPSGQNEDAPDDEIILNFYLSGLWAEADVSAETMSEKQAKSFGDKLIGVPFAIVESHTGRPSYFMTAYAYFPEEKAGSLYVAKISSIDGSVYQILYIKKIVGDSEKEVKDKATKLYNEGLDPKDVLYEKLDKLNIEDGWIEYLKTFKQNK